MILVQFVLIFVKELKYHFTISPDQFSFPLNAELIFTVECNDSTIIVADTWNRNDYLSSIQYINKAPCGLPPVYDSLAVIQIQFDESSCDCEIDLGSSIINGQYLVTATLVNKCDTLGEPIV